MMESSAHIRIYTFGPLSVERKQADGTWEPIAPSAWGRATYGSHTKSLLSYLLCCPQRHAFRGRITDDLWGSDLASVDDYMQRATSQLRHLLKDELYFTLAVNRTKYTLADQSLLWVDVDHCKTVLQEAQRIGVATPQGLVLLQEADYYFRRGRFLEEETGIWIHSRRSTIHTLSTDCFHWLLNAYEAQRQEKPREDLAEYLLREEPLNDDALYHLMTALHNRGMTSEALRRYRERATLAEKTEMVLSSDTQTLARRLQSELRNGIIEPGTETSNSLFPSSEESTIETKNQAKPTRREVLEIVGATTVSLAVPEIFGTEILQEFARVLNRPSVLEKHHLSLLEERTAQLWKYRDDGILLPGELYSTVDRHFQQIIHLLDGSLLPSIRTRLLTTASKLVTLRGALLYDLGRYEQAREHHRFAIQAAAQATQPILQAIAYAWMSFSWTYEQRYLEASHAIMQATSLFSDINEDRTTFGWLTAVAAEVSANLGKYDASCSFLEQAESSLETPSDQRYIYLHQFGNAAFRGFRGVCYQLLYQPKKPETHAMLEQARHSLEQALLDPSAFVRQKTLYLIDLASVYARQGEVEMACTLTKQAIDSIDQTTPKHVLQRLTEIQQRLQPWKETTYVKELDGFFRMVGII